MTASFVAEYNMAALCPPVAAGLGSAAVQLEGNLSAALKLQAKLSVTVPTLRAQLQTVIQVTESLTASIALGKPGLSFSTQQAAQLVAQAQAALGALAGLQAMLFGGEAFVYAYKGGQLNNIGSDIATAIAGTPPPNYSGTDIVAGVLVGASAWAEIAPFFGGLGT